MVQAVGQLRKRKSLSSPKLLHKVQAALHHILLQRIQLSFITWVILLILLLQAQLEV